jgi:sugar phosphate isomerase/epimerase
MRDLSHDRALLSINSMTVKAWSLEQLVEGCARAGLSAISPWRDIVQSCGLERAAKLIRTHGMTVTGLCRGGMFPAADEAGRRAALDDNRRAVDEAAAIGAQCLILVVGGLPKGSRDVAGARMQVRDALHALLPYARRSRVPLAIEPLHPMFAADRACVNTLASRSTPITSGGIPTWSVRSRAPGKTSSPTTSTIGSSRPPISCSTAA